MTDERMTHGHSYSGGFTVQQQISELIKERNELRKRAEKAEAENARLREIVKAAGEAAHCEYPRATDGFAPWRNCGDCVGCRVKAALKHAVTNPTTSPTSAEESEQDTIKLKRKKITKKPV